MSHRLLIVEDDESLRRVTEALFKQAGYNVTAVSTAEDAESRLEEDVFAAVLTDIRLPGKDGIQLLKKIREAHDTPVIVFTAHGTIQDAVRAMKLGASDFLEKPVEKEDLLATIERALSMPVAPPIETSVKTSDADTRVEKAAAVNAVVLLLGETGTGKSFVAQQIHDRSGRDPFIELNCAAIPESLIESELFGHEKGAFTGATHQRPGAFELADGGTIFLDEIGDLPFELQSKLLTVLQNKTFQRVGSTERRESDFRVIAATNRDLASMVEDGSFRSDLFFRLNVIEIMIPPLRETPARVPVLTDALVRKIADEYGTELLISPDALTELHRHDWPGNIRELENVLRRLAVFSSSGRIEGDDVRDLLEKESPPNEDLADAKRSAERNLIVQALKKTGGNRTKAAALLGISRRTLYNKLDLLDLS